MLLQTTFCCGDVQCTQNRMRLYNVDVTYHKKCILSGVVSVLFSEMPGDICGEARAKLY